MVRNLFVGCFLLTMVVLLMGCGTVLTDGPHKLDTPTPGVAHVIPWGIQNKHSGCVPQGVSPES